MMYLYDKLYQPSSSESQKKNVNLRHVIYRDPLTQKIFHFVCSDFKISARAIADIYKKRWAVELLFRWLKGHLDIRRLPTKTINAVRTMLATAVLFQLLLQLKKITDKFKGTLWDFSNSMNSAAFSLQIEFFRARSASACCSSKIVFSSKMAAFVSTISILYQYVNIEST